MTSEDPSQSAVTFEAIRSAAIAILQREGSDALTVRRVAKEAGVGMGTLRYYFPTSAELLEACLDHYHAGLSNLEQQMIAAIRGSSEASKVVERAVRAAYQLAMSQPDMHRLRLTTAVKKGELPRLRRDRSRTPFRENSAKALQAANANPPSDLRLIVDSLMRLVSHYAACSDDEVLDICEAKSPKAARAELENHLVATAHRLIFGGELTK